MHENTEDREEKPGRYHSEFFEWGEALAVALTGIILLFTFVVRLIGVDGSSMYPTLHDREKVLMSNLLYAPQKGDIIVLNKQSFLDSPIVKRVVATAGDTIDINFATMEVAVNGRTLDEPYVNPETVPPLRAGDMIFPQTVPEGCVFVMGDNRNHSSDSRIASLGMVDTRYILGHVLARVFPPDRIGGIS
ncbi:MAG: signal peptidase I [Intestinibacillus sp.]